MLNSPSNLALLPSSQSVAIDDKSVVKLQVIVAEQNVVVNIPFMLIGLGIILGGIFMFLMCRQKVPEVRVWDTHIEYANYLCQHYKR